MHVLLRLAPLACALVFAFQGCTKAPPPGPPAPRTITISVSSGAAPVRELAGRVVVVPYDDGRRELVDALIKRRKTEETLRKEEAELEKALPEEVTGITADAQPMQDRNLDRMIAAARQTIDSLADLGLIYYEEVAAQKGTKLPAERLAAFRQKLGVDELRRAGSGMKKDDPEGTRRSIQVVQEVLQREVYTAERLKPERQRAGTVLSQLTAELGKAPVNGIAGAAPAVEKVVGSRDLLMRYMNNRATLQQTTDPLRMFTALPNAKITASTDGDGKCTVQVPQGGRWIVGVCFQRPGKDLLSLNFGLSETFCWIEELPADRNQLSLTADNVMKRSVAPLGLEHSVPWR